MRAATISRTWGDGLAPGAQADQGNHARFRGAARHRHLRDWIDNGRALLNRAQARFEQALARMGERLGLGGRTWRQELQERRQQTAEPDRKESQAEMKRRQQGTEAARAASSPEVGGKPPWRRNSRACVRRRSASWPRSKSGKPRWPKNSQRSSGPSPPARADFLPYFLAPKRAMKSGIPNGRGSGTCC